MFYRASGSNMGAEMGQVGRTRILRIYLELEAEGLKKPVPASPGPSLQPARFSARVSSVPEDPNGPNTDRGPCCIHSSRLIDVWC